MLEIIKSGHPFLVLKGLQGRKYFKLEYSLKCTALIFICYHVYSRIQPYIVCLDHFKCLWTLFNSFPQYWAWIWKCLCSHPRCLFSWHPQKYKNQPDKTQIKLSRNARHTLYNICFLQIYVMWTWTDKTTWFLSNAAFLTYDLKNLMIRPFYRDVLAKILGFH